ncbi:hypothetical protein [Microcystis phage Mwe-JY25]
MSRPGSTPRIMAALAASLTLWLAGCQHPRPEPGWAAVAQAVKQRTAWASACPTPTERAKLVRIKGELEAAIAAGIPPDTLAEEWIRLDAAAHACRGSR